MDEPRDFVTSCPISITDYPQVLMAHGSGGKLMHHLIEKLFIPAFRNPYLAKQHDGAVFELDGKRFAFTTDSYVIRPVFFPGGDIGSLAVHGTVNDLAMCGARALFLSAGFIVEEGFSMESLWRVVQSMKQSAEAAGVEIVTGDTKVVEKGKGDGIFINTAGIGVIETTQTVNPDQVKKGDAILVNGDLGRHGIAIMAVREGLRFDSAIESDSASVHRLALKLLKANLGIHCLRDLTRGGLTSALVEIAKASRTKIRIDEMEVPVREDVKAACEFLGLDPFYVANEGRFVVFLDPQDAERALAIMREDVLGVNAKEIGVVEQGEAGLVTAKNQLGTHRILDVLSGDQLPRIC